METGDLRKTHDILGIQWTMIYLHDYDSVTFVQECIKCIKSNDIIFVKYNVDRIGFLVDKDYWGIMRSIRYILYFFKRAGVYFMK